MTTFMFDLELGGLTDERGRAVADECRSRGTWPAAFVPGRVEKRWFGVEKSYPPVLELPDHDEAGPAIAADAARDAHAINFRPDAAEAVAATVEIVADHFPEGLVFRATWAGSPIEHDEIVSIDELTAIVRASRLNEFTRYTVPPLTEVGGA